MTNDHFVLTDICFNFWLVLKPIRFLKPDRFRIFHFQCDYNYFVPSKTTTEKGGIVKVNFPFFNL